jgi:hypothetical protein
MLRQRAVLWTNTGTDHYGRNTFSSPVEILCRWEDQIGEFTGPRGETLTTKAMVYVDRDLAVGDIIRLGSLDSDAPETPDDVSDAWPVQAFSKLPDIKIRNYLRIAYL